LKYEQFFAYSSSFSLRKQQKLMPESFDVNKITVITQVMYRAFND